MANPLQSLRETLTGLIAPVRDAFNRAAGSISNASQGLTKPSVNRGPDFNNTFNGVNWSDHKTVYDEIMGLPPSMYYEPQDLGLILSSTLVMELQPGWPQLADSRTLTNAMGVYTFDSELGSQRYKDVIDSISLSTDMMGNGIDLRLEPPLKYAILTDVSIEESWSSDYGDTAFENINNLASDALSTFRYSSGSRDMHEMAESGTKAISGAAEQITGAVGGGELGELVGSITGNVGGGVTNLVKELQKLDKEKTSGLFETGLKILSGSKVDFPMVWRGSSYSPSYSVTIRLYNPVPASDEAYIKYIVRPIVSLFPFVLPRSDSDFTYSYPCLCSVRCPGLFQIKSGFIQNMSIVKGGENNDISFTQRPGCVDIRLTFSDTYSTMIAKISGNVAEDRPTLNSYLENLLGRMSTANIVRPPVTGVGEESRWTSLPDLNEKLASIPIGNSPYNPGNYNGQFYDDDLGHSRTPVGLNEADADLNVDVNNPAYPDYLLAKDKYKLESVNSSYFNENHNFALLYKYGLTNDPVAEEYFDTNYESMRDPLMDEIMGADYGIAPSIV